MVEASSGELSCHLDRKGVSSEALVLFATPVAANSATLLTNAKLGENLIEVSYYFSEFKHASSKAAFDYPPTEFEKKVAAMVDMT